MAQPPVNCCRCFWMIYLVIAASSYGWLSLYPSSCKGQNVAKKKTILRSSVEGTPRNRRWPRRGALRYEAGCLRHDVVFCQMYGLQDYNNNIVVSWEETGELFRFDSRGAVWLPNGVHILNWSITVVCLNCEKLCDLIYNQTSHQENGIGGAYAVVITFISSWPEVQKNRFK